MIRCKKCMPFDYILAPQCEVCGKTFVLGDIARSPQDGAVIEAAFEWAYSVSMSQEEAQAAHDLIEAIVAHPDWGKK